jgi:hypothetical protein
MGKACRPRALALELRRRIERAAANFRASTAVQREVLRGATKVRAEDLAVRVAMRDP